MYGFDYDYTLAVYKDSLHYLIYDLGRDALVKKFGVSVLCENQYANYQLTINNTPHLTLNFLLLML